MEVFVNDVGDEITLDTDQNLSEATALKMKVIRLTDGETDTWTASIDESDPEKMKYVTGTDDLSLAGIYELRAYAEWGESSKHTATRPCILVIESGLPTETRLRDVRAALNMTIEEEHKLEDEVIIRQIVRATQRLRPYSSLDEYLLSETRLAISAYLSYQAYVDEILPGTYDEMGSWQHVTSNSQRTMTEKLRSLRDDMNQLLTLLKEMLEDTVWGSGDPAFSIIPIGR